MIPVDLTPEEKVILIGTREIILRMVKGEFLVIDHVCRFESPITDEEEHERQRFIWGYHEPKDE